MSGIRVLGCGAVSPGGWGMSALREALAAGVALPATALPRPAGLAPVPGRVVPAPPRRPEFLAQPRLRRTSPISHYTVAAALEALGPEKALVASGELKLGIVSCVMCGCVNYSRRFYDETLKDPATASPLVFPETVFNAPASHLAALLADRAINYSIVGDEGAFLLGVALAAGWIETGKVDRCLVVGAEEMDWLTATAAGLFHDDFILGEGAGALYLGPGSAEPEASSVVLECVTDPHLFSNSTSRELASVRCREQLGAARPEELLFYTPGVNGGNRLHPDAWVDWPGPRLSPNAILGDAFMASSAWVCAAAVDAVARGAAAATASVLGSNEQAIAARFSRCR